MRTLFLAFTTATVCAATRLVAQRVVSTVELDVGVTGVHLAVGVDSLYGARLAATAGLRYLMTPFLEDSLGSWLDGAEALLDLAVRIPDSGLVRYRTAPLNGTFAQVFLVRDVTPSDTTLYVFMVSLLDSMPLPVQVTEPEGRGLVRALREAATLAQAGRASPPDGWVVTLTTADSPPRPKPIDACPECTAKMVAKSKNGAPPPFGVVGVGFVVDAKGRVERGTAEIYQWSDPESVPTVEDYLGKLRYHPARLAGQPVRQFLTVAFRDCAYSEVEKLGDVRVPRSEP